MSETRPTFDTTEEAREMFPKVSAGVDNAAFQLAYDFMDAGLGASEAASVAANMLIRAAWKVAGSGRVADGHTPNPVFFIEAAKDATETISFESLDAGTGTERESVINSVVNEGADSPTD